MTNAKAFREIVGEEWVTDDPRTLAGFSQDHSYVHPKEPVLVVKPKTSENVREVVRAARDQETKLVPVSSGPPRFRGDTLPAVENSVIVDLSAMKQILWINRRNRVAVVEPGVTFAELEPSLEKQGLRAMLPLLPRPNKSVVAAYMEREPFTVPKYSWDLADPIASAEMILGDGNYMRTGGGAGPGSLEHQRKIGGAHKLPLAPFGMDVRRIAQGSNGSIGICTWISLRCELLPEHETVYFAGAQCPEILVQSAQRFLYLRLVDELYVLNRLNFACLLEEECQEIQRLKDTLPPWILVMSISGSGELGADQFAYREADAKDEAKRIGIELQCEIGGVQASDYRERIVRKTSDASTWKLRCRGDCREIFFLTTRSRATEFVKAVEDLARKSGFDTESLGIYLQPVLQGTAYHCDFDLYMAPEDASKWESFYVDASKTLFEMGAYFSRPYGPWSDIVYGKYETFAKYARELKRIFDPNLILNPGKLCFKEMEDDATRLSL